MNNKHFTNVSINSIHYLMVANFKSKKILCDYSTKNDDKFQKTAKNLIKNFKENIRLSLTDEEKYTYYYQTYDRLIVLLITDLSYPSDSGFECVKQTEVGFKKRFSREKIDNAYSFSLNKEFRPFLKEKVVFFSKNQDILFDSSLKKLRDNILDTKETLLETSLILDERGDRLNEILDKSNSLKEDSIEYFTASKKVKKTAEGFNFKIIFLVLFFFILGYALMSVICGGTGMPNCLA